MSVISPFACRIAQMKERFITKNEIVPEVLDCYMNKITDHKVNVTWKRSGKYIIGRIFVDGEEYFAQGKSAIEFVEMVNDLIMAIDEIPFHYANRLNDMAMFRPADREFRKLDNKSVQSSSFAVRSKEVACA